MQMHGSNISHKLSMSWVDGINGVYTPSQDSFTCIKAVSPGKVYLSGQSRDGGGRRIFIH